MCKKKKYSVLAIKHTNITQMLQECYKNKTFILKLKYSLKKAEKTISQAENILTTGFNSTFEKEQVVEGLDVIKKELRLIPKSAAPEIVQQKIQLIQTLEDLTESINQSTNFRAKKDITSEFSKSEKKLIQAMLEVLTRNFARETVDSLYKEFLAEIKTKGKK